MHQSELIKTNMQVISSDGRRVGYVQRLTETDIVTSYPHRRIPIASVRRITDEVFIGLRYDEVQDEQSLEGTDGREDPF